MRPAKICILGLWGQGNLGNEVTLQALLHHTRHFFPDGELLCICSGPDDTSTRHDIRTVPINRRYRRDAARKRPPSRNRALRWLRRALIGVPREVLDWIAAFRALWGKDLLIVSGSWLLDFACHPFGWPYDVFRWSLVARLCGCRLLYVAVGAGPLYHPLSRWFVRAALSLAHFRSYRETSTIEYLKQLGFSREADRVCPDLAFSLPEVLIPSATIHRPRRRVVGIGLIWDPERLSAAAPNPAMYPAYLDMLAGFSRWLLANGYDVRLIIGDFVYDTPVIREFSASLREEVSRYEEGRFVDTPAASVEQLLSQLAETDLVVATRFHNVLLALLLAKPTIAISFHHKSVSLMTAMGQSEYLHDMGDAAVRHLIDRFETLANNEATVTAALRRRTEEYRDALDDQYQRIFADLDARASPRLARPDRQGGRSSHEVTSSSAEPS